MNLDNKDYQQMKSNSSVSETPEVEPQSKGMIDKALEAQEKVKETKDKIKTKNKLLSATLWWQTEISI